MSVLPILRWPDARLAAVCDPVEDPMALKQLAEDMLETMYAAQGRGLAAPQVGVLARMFVMDGLWKEGSYAPLVMINPEVIGVSEEMVWGDEACLSIPGVTAEVERHKIVVVKYSNLEGAVQEMPIAGDAAVIIQHEFDHLNGLVIFDRLEGAARTALAEQYEALT